MTPSPLPPLAATPSPERRHQDHRALAIEALLKLAVHGFLSFVAITAFGKLFPHYLNQQLKLKEMKLEVQQTEDRVQQLQGRFSRTFDPKQAQAIMQEQSPRVDPYQRRVIWLKDKNSPSPSP